MSAHYSNANIEENYLTLFFLTKIAVYLSNSKVIHAPSIPANITYKIFPRQGIQTT